MGQKLIIRLRWESALSSVSRYHFTTFCWFSSTTHV